MFILAVAVVKAAGKTGALYLDYALAVELEDELSQGCIQTGLLPGGEVTEGLQDRGGVLLQVGGQSCAVRGQAEIVPAGIRLTVFPREEGFLDQHPHRIADGGFGDLELPGQLTHVTQFRLVVGDEQEDLDLDGAETVGLPLVPELGLEDLGQAFQSV